MRRTHDPEQNALDRAIEAVRRLEPEPGQVAQASERVWEALRQKASEGSTEAQAQDGASHQLRSLDDYLDLLPAYLDGSLSLARRLLLDEEARRSIPLRRAIKAARSGKTHAEARAIAHGEAPPRTTLKPSEEGGAGWLRLAAAAVVAALAVGSGYLFWPVSQEQLLQVKNVEGRLFVVGDRGLEPLHVGDWVAGRQEVRTAKDSLVTLALNDGSLLEVDERTSLKVIGGRRGNTVRVDRGRIIVEAAKQRHGTLDVSTDEFLVSVKGTIFAVSHGTKGSRVSVIEGEVRVAQGREAHTLLPGDQLGTRATLASLPLAQEIGWSHDVDRYLSMLEEFAALRHDFNQLMTTEPRFSTRLLELAPADTAVYIAVPNATTKVAEAYDMIRSRLESNPELAEWWQQIQSSELSLGVDAFMTQLRELGELLGEETVITVSHQSGRGLGDDVEFLVLSEVNNPSVFAEALEQQIEALELQHGEDFDVVVVTALDQVPAGFDGVIVWLHDDLLLASPSLDTLVAAANRVAGSGDSFVGTRLYNLLLDSYNQGAEFLAAVDLGSFIEGESDRELELSGFSDVDVLLIERRHHDELAQTAATLTFTGPRHGLAAWLAAPAPMGALDFVSQDATLVTAFVVRDPVLLLDDLFAMAGREDVEDGLVRLEEETGLDLRTDILAPIGGEMAMALDGPTLPRPSWKLIVEVYDEARLQQTIEVLVARANEEAAARGIEAPLSLDEQSLGDRTLYRLSGNTPEGSVVGGFEDLMEAYYTYVDGYMVAAPSPTLIDRAIQYRDSGANLLASQEFQSLLPEDGYLDFSGVVFSRVGALVGDFLDRLPTSQALTAEQQQRLDEIASEAGPSLYCVYGEEDRIRMVSNGPSDLPFGGFGQFLGLGAVSRGLNQLGPIADLFPDMDASAADRSYDRRQDGYQEAEEAVAWR